MSPTYYSNTQTLVVNACFSYNLLQTQTCDTYQENDIKPSMVETELQFAEYFSNDLSTIDNAIM